MDCINHFKTMQDCFREHPDVYAGELADDESEEMDEGLKLEKEELEREVEERKAAVREKLAEKEKEKQRPKPKRGLLEEESTARYPPSPAQTPQSEQPGTEPHPGMSENHATAAAYEKREAMSEGAPSRLTRRPRPTTIPKDSTSDPEKQKFDADLELMPKAWHDARQSGGEAQHQGKEGNKKSMPK